MTGNSYIGLDKNNLKRKVEEVNRTNTLKTYALFSGILAIASVLLIIAMMLIIFVVRGFYLDWGYFIEFSLGVMFASFILFIASAELYLSALNFVPEKLLKKEDEKKAEIDDLIRIFVKFSQKRERQAKIAKNIGLLLITVISFYIGGMDIYLHFLHVYQLPFMDTIK